MKIKELGKKAAEDLWWIFKRDSWIIAITSIMVGKYTDVIPTQNLINFLEKGCLPYIIFIPLPILTVIILSHICTQGQNKLKPTSSRRTVQALYAAGTIVVLFAHVVTIHVSAMMLFYKTPMTPNNATLDFWYQVEIVYALVFTPLFDWYVFRRIIPNAFSDEKKDMKETWYCHILNIPRKNLIASALGFFILVVLLEIVC